MKVSATLSVSINIKGDEHHEEVHDKVIHRLINVCDGWLNGDTVPDIRISYNLDNDSINAKPTEAN